MTDTPKPPPVLYFRENFSTVYMDGSHMDNRFGHAFANKKRESDVGPYVHLDQFLEEVATRAEFFNDSPRLEAIGFAVQELAKELKENNEKS